jgi:predicted peroxiredoxin
MAHASRTRLYVERIIVATYRLLCRLQTSDQRAGRTKFNLSDLAKEFIEMGIQIPSCTKSLCVVNQMKSLLEFQQIHSQLLLFGKRASFREHGIYLVIYNAPYYY